MSQMPAKQNRRNDEPTRSALTQMIVKLRWIGLEDEAKQLEREVRELPAEQRCGVSLGSFSTD
jgi:hypothetical protein